jgi:hypothetical protein
MAFSLRSERTCAAAVEAALVALRLTRFVAAAEDEDDFVAAAG